MQPFSSVLDNSKQTPSIRQSSSDRKRGVDILAKSLYRDLIAQGYEQKHIVTLATALLGEVTKGTQH